MTILGGTILDGGGGGGGGASDWVSLSDTPGAIPAGNLPVQSSAGGGALEFGANPISGYLRRDGSNTITGVITADGDQTRSFGAGATRFDRVHGRLLTALGASTGAGGKSGTDVGTRSYGANPTGVIGGNMVEYGAGAAYFRHGQAGGAANPFKPVATVGNVFAGYGGGDATLRNNGGGAFLGGSVYTYGSGDAALVANSFGSFTWAYSYAVGAGPHDWINTGSGSVLLGYSQGTGTVAVTNSGLGCFTAVRPIASGAFTSTVTNSGQGAFLNGYLNSAAASSTMQAIATGAFAQGSAVNGGTVQANGLGSFAQGIAQNAGSDIIAVGQGTFAHGRARTGFAITASGRGSFAVGDANVGAISAAATNAFQLGPGVNAQALSLEVGQVGALGTGIRFHGLGVPAVPVNGDIWVDALGQITMMSGGVVCVATNAVM